MTMAEVEMEPPTDGASRSTGYKTNNNHPLAMNKNNNNNNNNHGARPLVVKHKKRKRLNQVLDRLTGQATSPSNNNNNNNNGSIINNNNNNSNNHNNNKEDQDVVMDGDVVIKEEVMVMVIDDVAVKNDVVNGGGGGVGGWYDSDESLKRSSKDYEEPFSPAGSSSCNRSPRSSHTDSPYSPNRTKSDDSVHPPACPPLPPAQIEFPPHRSATTTPPPPPLPPHPLQHFLCKYPKCNCLFCGGDGSSPPRHPLPPILPPQQTPVSPVSPASLLAGSMYTFEHYLHTKYLPDIFRKRRSHSDSDVPMWFEATKAEQCGGGGDENNTVTTSTAAAGTAVGVGASKNGKRPFSVPHPLDKPTRKRPGRPAASSAARPPQPPQDSPLDLTMKNCIQLLAANAVTSGPGRVNCTDATAIANTVPTPPATSVVSVGYYCSRPGSAGGGYTVPVVKGDVASCTTKASVAVRYNLEVSPVVEEMPVGSDVAYVCPVCGQMFSLHDRLAKHMASRHKNNNNNNNNSSSSGAGASSGNGSQSGENGGDGSGNGTAKAYPCEVCNRSFARSDMLTRHMRLHTGVKPYTCRVCGQVFSRSDHLSTHQRTHTGEKPYKCPQCPYAACRRDMITRHMRTHSRYETVSSSSPSSMAAALGLDPMSPPPMPPPPPPPPPPPSGSPVAGYHQRGLPRLSPPLEVLSCKSELP